MRIYTCNKRKKIKRVVSKIFRPVISWPHFLVFILCFCGNETEKLIEETKGLKKKIMGNSETG